MWLRLLHHPHREARRPQGPRHCDRSPTGDARAPEKKLAAEKVTNVVPLLATPDDAKLPRGEVDLVLMVDVYHEVPKPPVTLAQIKNALAPKGRLALVEYKAEDPKVAIKPEHKTTLVQLRRELEANGFMFVSTDESLPEQRIVVFEPAR